ncbi:MAG TPA: hypothetical protein VGO23_12925 [Pseudonocardia sp.]|nr:hypothetical protein [Pseudonocardia sp.]
MPDLRSLPKAHLHVHAESTVRPSTLRELAHGLPAPPPRTRFDGFRDFGDHGGLVRACLRSPADFTRVGTELMQDEAAQARDTWRSRSPPRPTVSGWATRTCPSTRCSPACGAAPPRPASRSG